MNIPKIDLEELKALKEENFKDRLKFISKYADWMKKKSNSEWSSQHKKIID